MSDLLATARRLRAVRNAYGQFLTRWLVEKLEQEERALDQLARDLAPRAAGTFHFGNADHQPRTLLYRGVDLDD